MRVELPLHRLRARHEYVAELFVQRDDDDETDGGGDAAAATSKSTARRGARASFATGDVEGCSSFGNSALVDITLSGDDVSGGFTFEAGGMFKYE